MVAGSSKKKRGKNISWASVKKGASYMVLVVQSEYGNDVGAS